MSLSHFNINNCPGTAYLRMRHADYGAKFWTARGARSIIGAAVNVTLIAIGFFFLGAGTYVSVQSIIDGYASGSFGGAFSCESNALAPNVSPPSKRWFVEGARLLSRSVNVSGVSM